METKKYQVRIRKDVTLDPNIQKSIALLGGGTATEIKTLSGDFENINDLFEKIANLRELIGWEIISLILVDADNSDQLGEDFNWDNVK